MLANRHQTRILGAARTLVRRRGYAQVSLRQIAAEARYSPAGLYAHYAGLAAILDALAAQVRQDLAAHLDAAAASAADPVEQLVAVGLAYIDFAVAHPAEFEVLFRHTRSHRKGGSATSFDLLRTLARRVAPSDRDDTIDAACLGLWAAAHGLADLRIAHLADAPVDWKSMARTILLQQLAGLSCAKR